VLIKGLRNLFKRRVAKETAYVPKGYRGRHVFDYDKCTRCGICVKFCPTKTIEFVPDGKVRFMLDKCIFCAQCEEVCPYDAIHLKRGFYNQGGDVIR
jgi:formate hydrogenlyase subunit 6/NADH:ubiquinone oxidoreductase subunit I